ncbi:hypothetical protein [Pseudomonas sp. O230]|uniref:hypothetical protein n=1 Tax=Pseudomonas sp. O230 TaxID=3159450 RepID=UPI00387B72B7
MNSQFKPGDLALIVSCPLVPTLIGRCVQLVEGIGPGCDSFSAHGPWFNRGDANAWVVEADGLVSLTISKTLVDHPRCCIAEKYLMPLRGNFEFGQQKAKEAV